MAPHSTTLAWKISWTEEPGRLQSLGSLRVRHNWATSLSLFTFMRWRRKWQPTPVFLPGESQGQRSLVGCRLWGSTELDTMKRLSSSSRTYLVYLLCLPVFFLPWNLISTMAGTMPVLFTAFQWGHSHFIIWKQKSGVYPNITFKWLYSS